MVQTLKTNTEVSGDSDVTGTDTTPIVQREISTQTPTPVSTPQMSHVAWSACLCIRHTAEPIEMPFGGWGLTIVDAGDRVLDGGQDRTNPFAAATVDKSAIRPFAELL